MTEANPIRDPVRAALIRRLDVQLAKNPRSPLNNLLSDCRAALAEPAWVPVSERLPESAYEEVLVAVHRPASRYFDELRFVSTLALNAERVWGESRDGEWVECDHVTHWMPLPSPPMEEPKT